MEQTILRPMRRLVKGPYYENKISRKEAKESRYWLRLVDTNDEQQMQGDRNALIEEATELMNIFGTILHKCQ